MTDTIVALATPPGEGGIAIVRLSGPDAIRIGDALFRSRTPLRTAPSHALIYGRLSLDGTHVPGGDLGDEVLVSLMRSPRSYTREDVVEINCHGGTRLADEVIRACLRHGARRAERGEFTERAFLNGRLDLTQAEAVLDMVKARTRDGLAAAYYELSGSLSARISVLRDRLTASLARIETGLEFDEENSGLGDPRGEVAELSEGLAEVESLAGTYARGRLIADGATVAIVGPPNVGKSSLLNAILGEERAIVSPLPGTTRDTVHGEVEIGGLCVRLVDTAGLRPAGDPVEREGTRRAERAADIADLVVLVCDGSGTVRGDFSPIANRRALVAINKMDIASPDAVQEIVSAAGARPVFEVCALSGDGVDTLCGGIRDSLVAPGAEPANAEIITRARHADALAATGGHIRRALAEIAGQAREELVAADIRLALDSLGAITGETTPEEVVHRIFADFCVGK